MIKKSAERNKAILRRFWEEVFNGRNLDIIEELFDKNWVYHGPAGQEVHGPEGLKQYLTLYFNAFPDLHAKVEDVFAEGDRVGSRATCLGTHKGELMGIAPTGKKATITVICISRLMNDKIVEDWELVDLFGMMQQLGMVPLPAQPGK
jgi:steroid delta-isomerase-like uncharacterized protein